MESSELTLEIGRMQGQVEMLTLLVVVVLVINVGILIWLAWRRSSGQPVSSEQKSSEAPSALSDEQTDIVRQAEVLVLRGLNAQAPLLDSLHDLAAHGDGYSQLLHQFLDGRWRKEAAASDALSDDLLKRFNEKGAHPWINLMIADIAAFRQQVDLAGEHLRLALEQRGREAPIWQRMGEVHLMRDEADHAIDCLQKAVELEMKSSRAWLLMGWAELLAHRPDMVDQHLKFAYDFAEPGEEQAVQRRANMVSALAKAALGDEGEATTLLDVLLDLHRNEATAREMLESLEKVAPLYPEQGSLFLRLRSMLLKHMDQQGFSQPG